MKQFRSGFSDFQCDTDELIDDGVRVAVRWLGIAPTNRKIEFSETHHFGFQAAALPKITFPQTSWIY